MMFPNAHEGVKKIYKSQILSLISSALFALTCILALIAIVALSKKNEGLVAGTGVGMLLCGIAAAVIGVIALVFYIMGINRAKLDESSFTKALICVLVSLACSILSGFFTKNAVVVNLISIVNSAASVLATVFIIFGIQALAKKLQRPDIDDLGKKLLYIIIAVNVLSIIINILATIFDGNPAMAVVGRVLSMISSVLSIVSTVVYLVFLSKATKMLEA